MKLLNTLVSKFLIVFLLSGCGLMSVKSDDLDPMALEKNVNASTRSGGSQTTIGSYSTRYTESSNGRAHNIKLAANKLNQTKIAPGETFSFNNSVGATGKSAGFKKSRIFVNGKDSEGYGGGVCQVSSTLYNAALEAGLTIVERSPHSKHVGYVPEGKDAATSYGSTDLKIKNNTKNSLVIESSAGGGKISVSIRKA